MQLNQLKALSALSQEPITNIAWSPDGSFLATGSRHGVILWDLANGIPSKQFPTKQEVQALSWSPDTKFLASGSYDVYDLFIWDLDGSILYSHTGEREEYMGAETLTSIAWSSATGMLAEAHANGSILVWNTDEWTETETWRLVSKPQWIPLQITNEIAWAPDGILLASAEQNSEVRLWDVETGELRNTLKEHSDSVFSVAWSADGELLASGGRDKAVLIWNPNDPTQLKRLEGHVGTVNCVRFSADGKLLASASDDNTVRIWDPVAGVPLSVINAAGGSFLSKVIAFHPSAPQLATLDEEGTGVRIWQWDPEQQATTHAEAIRYTTARIVLVGDSGVGKTGLGWRLAHGQFKEHPSTHGQQFWALEQLEAARADGVQCEAVLWDLAGQPDYRLVHSLLLDTVDLALLLFDPTNRQEPLAGVDYWLRHLQAGKSEPPSIILVGARTDRGSPTLTDAELAAVCKQRGIAGGYIGTSAKDGDGIAGLMTTVKSLIPWESMSATVTTITFKHVRDYVLSLKENAARAGVMVSVPTVRQQLENTDPDWDFTDAEMITAIHHLETHGYVRLLRGTAGDEFVLLLPEILSKLASSIVLEARREMHGLGALDEERLLGGNYRLPELDGLDHTECRILLDAVVLLFLEHNICFREYLGNRVLLVFPSLINEQRPLISDSPIVEDASYTLSGAVENVYAALVVLLGYTNTFTRTHQWQNQAQYQLGDGEICGFRQVDQGKGVVELVLYYGSTTPERVKSLFQGLFETFLVRRDLNIVRHRPVRCRNCGEHQDHVVVMKQMDRGRTFIFCAVCGSKIDIPGPEDLTVTVTGSREVHAQKQVAGHRTAFEAGLVNVKSLLLERGTARAKPTCFISYAWGRPEHERWVLQLAKDLRNADINVLLDRWHSPPGADLGRYIDHILSSQFVVVVGTPELQRKYETNTADPVVAAELELIALRVRQPQQYGRTVLPVLLQGAAHEAFPPQLQKLVSIDFRQDQSYFTQLWVMIWQLYQLPFDHPLLEELQTAMALL